MISARNNKVLIVDDQPLNRLFLADLLKMHEINPTEATNGNEAVQQWLKNDYAVILMDIKMPDLNGIDATRIIRQKEMEQGLAKTPIIAVTAYGTKETQNDCRNAGMDGYIPKPVNVSDLLEMIENLH
ncbi:MAG: response regulator [Thermodesulfobacteriota bacterium]